MSADTAASAPTYRDAPADDGGIIGLAACRRGAYPRRLNLPATIEVETLPHRCVFRSRAPIGRVWLFALRASNQLLLPHTTLSHSRLLPRCPPLQSPRRQEHPGWVAAHRRGGATDGSASADASPVGNSGTACAARSCPHAWGSTVVVGTVRPCHRLPAVWLCPTLPCCWSAACRVRRHLPASIDSRC